MSLKIVDLLRNKQKFSYSCEVTPDIDRNKIENLTIEPAFFCVTWHAKSYDFIDCDTPPLMLSKYLRSKGKVVCMHLSCDLLKRAYLKKILKYLKENEICNLFIVLGESYDYQNSDFKYSKDLIAYIRRETGSYFCIGVAGFPTCSDIALSRLKEKIDIGVDFIITQAFFELASFNEFVENSAKIGIHVPIIPGLFLYETQRELVGFSDLCKIKIPAEILESKGCTHKLIKEILQNSNLNHLHFFTLNKLDFVSNTVQNILIIEEK